MNQKIRYNKEFLDKFCNDNDIKYEIKNEKDDKNINRDSFIKGNCKSTNCKEFFEKRFRALIENGGPYCNKCTIINSRNKYKETNKEKYGYENPFQVESIKDKIKKSNMDKYGVEHPMYLDETKKKMEKTFIKKYGVKNPMQSESIRKKVINTCIERYGVEHPLHSSDIKDKIKKTNMDRYGVEYNMQLDDNKEKFRNTCIERYGVKNPNQSEDIKKKKVEIYIKKFGVEHPMQNSNIAEKCSKNSYKSKEYVFPSGIKIKCQGYENIALDILLKTINENDILTSKNEVPEIWYKDDNGKRCRYYVDIYIKSINKFIEVKSTWTYKKDEKKIKLTSKTIKELGFLYECWVFSTNKEDSLKIEEL